MADFSFITSCVKYMLFIFNLAFVITGIIIISVGAVVEAEYDNYSSLLDEPYRSIPALLIAIGVLIFIVAFFGCCGAIKENYCMTLTFSVMLIGIFILEVAAGISGFVLRDRTNSLIQKSMMDSIPIYAKNDTPAITAIWDEMQRDFECCGVINSSDWKSAGGLFTNGSLPMSCCSLQPGAILSVNCNALSENLYHIGCSPALSDFLRKHANSIGATGVCIAILQFIGIIFACHLAKRTKYETTD